MRFHIIGFGGVGTYFITPFLKTIRHMPRFRRTEVCIVDGDAVEEHNLMRQNFTKSDVGQYKANCFAERNVTAVPLYLGQGNYTNKVRPGDWMFVFVDNHLARKHALSLVDEKNLRTIIAANSFIGAHAYYYDPFFKDGVADPRVRFPQILTDVDGSPLYREAGCVSEARLEEVPQTPIANMMAAAEALLLFNFWEFERPKLDIDPKFLPLEFSSCASSMRRTTMEDLSN